MKRAMILLVCASLFAPSLFASAEEPTFCTLALTSVQQGLVVKGVGAVFGRRVIARSQFDQKLPELWAQTLTLVLSDQQKAKVKASCGRIASEAKLGMSRVLVVGLINPNNDVNFAVDPLGSVQGKRALEYKVSVASLPAVELQCSALE